MEIINSIEVKYVAELIKEEEEFKAKSLFGFTRPQTSKHDRQIIKAIRFLLMSFYSTAKFLFDININPGKYKNKRFVFTAVNFCKNVDGKLVDRVLKPLKLDNLIYINPSKQNYIDQIDGHQVINTGGLIKLLAWLSKTPIPYLRIIESSQQVNDLFIKKIAGNEIYLLWFYEMNSLGIIFSKYRSRVKLIEVQHGSMINYPPYQKPAPIRIADMFYVKNQKTIEYLTTHLNRNFPSEYKLIPYPKVDRQPKPGIHLLYASTIEFQGFHPVMKKFILDAKDQELELIVRLHPREAGRENLFLRELEDVKFKVDFDRSENWLENHKVSNLIVISPWSSMIEDAVDNGFRTIIIDPVGKERYAHLLDDEKSIYSNDVLASLKTICPEYVVEHWS